MGFFLVLTLLLPLTAAAGEEPPRLRSDATEVAVEPPRPVPVAELMARRSRLASQLGDALLVVESGSPREGEAVDRDFFYLTGLEVSPAALLLEIRGGRGTARLFLPDRDEKWERWNGPRPHPGEEALRRSGVSSVESHGRFDEALAQALRESAVAYLPADRTPLDGGPGSPVAERRYPDLESVETSGRPVHRLRQVKSDFELDRLRRAVAVTGYALERAIRSLRGLEHEFQVEAIIEGAFRDRGATGPGFPSIVGAGPRACVLHYQQNDGPIRSGDLLLMDVGAQVDGYTADITRTVPVSGRFTPRQREIYELVLRAQRAGLETVRPGVTLRDVHRAARAVVEEAGLRQTFLHGTCHHVGLDVHDVTPERILAPGMVITVEPGVYLPEEGLGVRIEDMVVVTEEGCEILSAAIPKSVEVMESWVSGKSPRGPR